VLNAVYKIEQAGQASPPSTSLATMTITAGPIFVLDDSSDPGTTVTECFNLRPVLSRLYVPAHSPAEENSESTRAEISRRIADLIQETVAPTSWRDRGGNLPTGPGVMRQVESVLIVTQTPENLKKVHNVLDSLSRATFADDFPASHATPATRPVEITPADGPLDQAEPHVTAYLNIRPVKQLWIAHMPRDGETRDPRIVDFITQKVAPDSWVQDDNKLFEMGGILVVSQTSKNVQAVQKTIGDLYQSMLRNDFPSALQPMAPSTKPVN
jgi:hypothetical protein